MESLMRRGRGWLLLLAVLFIALTGCPKRPADVVTPEPPLQLRPASYSELPGWAGDDLSQTLPALEKSCARIAKRDPADAFSKDLDAGNNGRWQQACEQVLAAPVDGLRKIIEAQFAPWEVSAGGDPQGLFTGYFEASLRGSRTRHGEYQTPLLAVPDDLVMVDLGDFREDLKGRRIAGRVANRKLIPYASRAEIVIGPVDESQVLFWVDDPVDAFFLQIQGSGVLQLDDGSTARVGYAAQNGHPYYAIGRELIKRGELSSEGMSMQAIVGWLEQNPDQADEIMNTNASYVYFEERTADGAVGGEGVVLTPGRSLAIDRSLIPYGVPLWVDIAPPTGNSEPLQRLMIAQDTGGAIRGPVRGDVFWGFGPAAEATAGAMKSAGRYWILLPRQPAQ